MLALKHIKAGEDWKIPGPVHGFVSACSHLGIALDTNQRGLTITSPYGTSIEVTSADRTLFNLIVRDSVRYTILDGLQQRTTTPGGQGYRKDMPGAGPYLDVKATRINIVDLGDAPRSEERRLNPV